MVSCFFTPNEESNKRTFDFMCYMNALNGTAIVTRTYVDKDWTFIVEAFYTGEYNKVDFGQFLTRFNQEVEKIVKLPATGELLE